ncbi:TonB-dependent receptor domain-containing protein [Caulobacter segnis]
MEPVVAGRDGGQLFANLARSRSRPPNFEFDDPDQHRLHPCPAQKAWTGEVGARPPRSVHHDLTLYRAELKDEMLQYAVTSSIPAATFNADKTVHQGIEAALDWAPAKHWRIRQTWTYSDFRFKDDVQFGDNRLPIVPKAFYRSEVRYDDPRGWFLAPSVEWSATDAWIDYANTKKTPSYAILNLNAGWEVSERVSLFLDARNLADKAYVSSTQAAIAWTAATATLAGPATAVRCSAALR